MAGNHERVPDKENFTRPSGPKVKMFACPVCGASVTIRCPGNTLSAVCDSCFSVLDTHDENVAILTRYFAKAKLHVSKIEFGTRGVLKGRKWECIGFVVRKDCASSFMWEEYLLFNPYYGYRWLTLSKGHWSFVTTTKSKPRVGFPYAHLDNTRYRLYYSGNAEYIYVLGEFYWRVAVGKKVLMEDFIAPPYMLSSEKDENELVWASSEYVEPKEVAKAFNIKQEDMPSPRGVAPNQPSAATANWHSMLRTWLICLVVLFGIQVFHVAGCKSLVANREGFSFVTNMKVIDLSSKKFTISKKSAVEINVYAPADNSWVYVEGDLVDNKSGETYPIGESVEYYHGYSDGESWTEGGTTTSMTIPQVPPGEYYINMDVQSGDFPESKQQRGFTVTVIEDVPQFSNFWWSVLLVSIAPCWWFFLSYCAESQRWSDSDYSPYQSDG